MDAGTTHTAHLSLTSRTLLRWWNVQKTNIWSVSRTLETKTHKEFHKPPRAYPSALFRFLPQQRHQQQRSSINRSYSRSTLGRVGGPGIWWRDHSSSSLQGWGSSRKNCGSLPPDVERGSRENEKRLSQRDKALADQVQQTRYGRGINLAE